MDLLEIIPKVNENIINETLMRMGVGDKKRKILYPSCHLYKDIDSHYYLCHFKEMFLLRSTRPSFNNFSEDDLLRRNSVALLLEDWDMIEILNLPEENDTVFIFTLSNAEKKDWLIQPKFNPRTLT
jgi:hypothetical protein